MIKFPVEVSGITGGTSAKEALKGLSTRYKVYSTNIIWEDSCKFRRV
jgi:hypothetical protein